MECREKNFMSAVVYVHNAEKTIELFLREIINVFEDVYEHSEIICVNDYSDDRSLEIIKNVSSEAKRTSITVLNMSYFHGRELSMNAGIDLSIGDFVFEFDRPVLDFNKNIILQVYGKALEGYDIVSASSNAKQRLSSKLFYRVFDLFTDFSYKMNTEGFRILSRRVINRIGSMNKTVPYRKVVYAKCGLKMDTIKYDSQEQMSHKHDRMEDKYRFSLAVDSLILFTNFGYRFSITMTIFMMIASIFMIFYSLTIYITSHPVEGWTTTMLFLSIISFALLGVLTIIIKYLQLLVNLVFKRKQYSFESIEKLTK